MDLTRTRGADWLAAAGGLVLLLSLFLPWYDVQDFGISGWESLSVIDVVLALLALLAMAVPLVTAAREAPAVPIVVTVVTCMLALVAIVLVLIRVIWTPSLIPDGFVFAIPGGGERTFDVGRDWGLWVAVVATLVTTVGSWHALRDERSPSARPSPEPQRQPAPLVQAASS